MITGRLSSHIQALFGFPPTHGQAQAIDVFCRFAAEGGRRGVMLMCGSAGTGKTSLAAAMVKATCRMGQKVVLMAPTGRAAKVFALSAGMPAFTIHRKIYRQKAFTGDMTGFNLNVNLHKDTLFVVDEASMISDSGISDSAAFGSGNLLSDLINFVYRGEDCRLMLIGDKAQLPPVGGEESPALSPDVLSVYGLDVYSANLTEVLRQAANSGVLYNATRIRDMIACGGPAELPRVKVSGFADIRFIGGSDIVEALCASYSEVGMDETTVITRSNRQAGIYNRGIRSMVLGRDDELASGDMVMVVRNNYYWAEKEKQAALSFIANGDRAVVQRVRNIREVYGFRFADVSLAFSDYDDSELQATVIMDSLHTDAPSLTREQDRKLFEAVMEDYADLPRKADRISGIKNDAYYNALQVKFSYAVTCHKAQGGKWEHVYVDQGYMTDDMLTPDYLHWLYTAFTRAAGKLFLVNWNRRQMEG